MPSSRNLNIGSLLCSWRGLWTRSPLGGHDWECLSVSPKYRARCKTCGADRQKDTMLAEALTENERLRAMITRAEPMPNSNVNTGEKMGWGYTPRAECSGFGTWLYYSWWTSLPRRRGWRFLGVTRDEKRHLRWAHGLRESQKESN